VKAGGKVLSRPVGRRLVWPVAASAIVLLGGCTSVASIPVAAAPKATSTPPAAAAASTCTPAEKAIQEESYPPLSSLPPAGQAPPDAFMQKIFAHGKLIVGVSADTRLLGARNPKDNTIVGFDIDMLQAISQQIFGKPDQLEFRVISAAQRIPFLKDGTVDIVARAFTVNCDRWKQIDFSSVYFLAGQRLLVPISSKVSDIGQLASGSRVCAPAGSTSIDRIKSNYQKLVPVEVAVHTDCLVLFQQGKVDAITGDDAVLAGFQAQDPYTQVVGPQFSREPYGLGIKQGNTYFVQYVNAVLDRVRTSGQWQADYASSGLQQALLPAKPTPPTPTAFRPLP
jgi:polar amino acid transport system substrate-binding protein